jgi:TonB-linked SusC/RagA family outer membrane protein
MINFMKANLLKTLIKMSKYATFCIILQSCLYSFAIAHSSKGQVKMLSEIELNLTFDKSNLKKVFREIEKNTDFTFAYSPDDLPKEKVSLPVKLRSLKEVLLIVAEQAGVSFRRVNETIHVKPYSDGQVIVEELIENAIQVTGTVTSTEGVPLPGVSILIKGTNTGTVTDIDGYFNINVPGEENILVFSFIGYTTKEVAVNGRTTINVTLEEDVQALDEVVVVAFGEQKKEDVIGSVTTVKPSELKVPSSNLTTALAGRVAGVISYQRSGEPGQDNADFFIRGVTTFGYKKDPLILIDGIESTSTDLARLQPDDVESFSIMKDATATALYGSRAANGVVLIKTKEGKEGKAKISLRMENSISMPTRNVELADPITYMKLYKEGVLTRDPLGISPYTDEKIEQTMAGANEYMYPATDWREALIEDYTMNQRANLNVKGGGKVARYYVAGSFNQDNGLLKVDGQNNFNNNVDLKTYSLRSNVNVNLTSSTKMTVRLSGTFDDYTGPIDGGGQVYRNIMRTNPVLFPPYYPADEDHKYVQHILFGNYENDGDFYLNPYAELVKGYRDYSRSVMSAQFQVKQDLSFLTDGLRLRSMFNTKRYAYFSMTRAYKPFWYHASNYDKTTDTYDLEMLNEENGTEYLDYNPGRKDVESGFYMETALNYNHTFNKKHTFSGAFVFMVQNRFTGNAGDLQASLPFRNVGIAGRATYSYKSRYFTEINFGYNASERFYKNKRWGFFPSAGMAWTISNERFWEPLQHMINKLRLRATYGLSGNDAIGAANDRFLYLSNLNMNDGSRGAVFGRDNDYSQPGMSLSRYSDPTITWEKAAKTNIALEVGILDRWNIEADFFKEVRTNILQTRVATPAEMGLSAQPKANIGEAEGKGVDLSVDYNYWFNNNLWLQARGNFTYATSEFLVYEEFDYQDAPWKSHIGYSINQRWGYLAERLFVDDEEAARAPRQNFGEYGGGDIKYRDVNGDGRITRLDQVPLGYPTTPEIVYGFGFSIGYKNFDFSAFFQGLANESFWIDARATAPFVGETQLLKAYADDHWSEEDQDLYALWPRLSTVSAAGVDNNAQRSTWFMRNGSFLRLKQVELGYTLPQHLLDKFHMKSLRIYMNSTNPYLWSNFKLWDVEMGGNGLGYPIQKVFNLGVKVDF